MNYVAIYISAEGDIICNPETGKVMNLAIG